MESHAVHQKMQTITVKKNSDKKIFYVFLSLSLFLQLCSCALRYGCPARPLIKPCSCREITVGLDVSCEGKWLINRYLIDYWLALISYFIHKYIGFLINKQFLKHFSQNILFLIHNMCDNTLYMNSSNALQISHHIIHICEKKQHINCVQ